MNQILDDYSFDTAQSQAAARSFFSKVYAFMFGALLISGAIAYQYGTKEFISEYFIQAKANGQIGLSPLFYIVVFSPIGIALLMQTMVNRLSFPVLVFLFAVYSVLIGLSLSTIFIVYSMSSIALTFAVTSVSFGAMAILGFTTKIDLTKMGSILYIGFIGIFVASLLNFWMNNDTLDYIISIGGVIVFTGLTAYTMQQLKQMAYDSSLSADQKNKMALIGGFKLYIMFVNLFLSLLRLFGSRD